MSTLYQSKLEAIADALAAHVAAAPALAAESCEVISRVDDTIGSKIEERVGKAGGLLCIITAPSVRALREGDPGPRVRATFLLTLWARRSQRTQRNSGTVLHEALLAAAQGWEPEGGLCYDQFHLVSSALQPHEKFTIYSATFVATVQLSPPLPVPDP